MQQFVEKPLPPGPSVRTIPEGDDRERLVCPACGFVAYENPKVIVGAVATWEGKYLLCRRGIEPRTGYWTIPAGYMELSETSEAGAMREVWEEAGAKVKVDALLAVFNNPSISQVYLIYRAEMLTGDFAAGLESLDVQLFAWEDIPWDEMAYPNVRWLLNYHRDVIGQCAFAPLGAVGG